MGEDVFQVRFWGVRGSVPVSGPQFQRYGGNTACIEVQCGSHIVFFDAGSGLRPAGDALRAAPNSDYDVFFTHCHYDHIVGLPFFAPLYDPRARVVLWSGHLAGLMTTQEMLGDFMRPPWFPVRLDVCKASYECRDFVSGDVLNPRPDIVVRTASLNHPGGCIGYRLEWRDRILAVITDTEHEPGALDPAVFGLIQNADLVVYDCTYTEEEMPYRRGFGHSTWQQGVKLCEAAGARGLALFHHDPARTDAELRFIERRAKLEFSGAFAARDGQTLEFTPHRRD
jgi:phosphoribosyl 1,2-cyclic phosphodiesterase